MPEQEMDYKLALSAFLSGAELDPTIRNQCEHLARSSSELLNMAAVGLLLDPSLKLGTPKAQANVQFRLGLWIEALSKKRLRRIEDLAAAEIERLITELSSVELEKLDSVRTLELRNQYKLIVAVNRVLLRAKRVYIEAKLLDLDDWLPPWH
jgi:hypothetical protein